MLDAVSIFVQMDNILIENLHSLSAFSALQFNNNNNNKTQLNSPQNEKMFVHVCALEFICI